MSSPPSSLTPQSVPPPSGDRIHTGTRKTAIAKFLTVQQVADIAEVSTRTVRRWTASKLLIAHRVGGVLRISDADFRAFLATHRED
jgi:excisionase family DNA binding protein